MIRQACSHRWGALAPSRINRTVACPLVQWQLAPQAHRRSGDIIEGLKEDHPLPQAFAVFAEAGGLATQWRQSLPQGQVHPFDQSGAAREAQMRQAFGAQHDAGAERQQLAVLLLFDQLPRDQIGRGCTDGLAGAARFPVGANVITTWKAAMSAAR